MRWLVAHGTPEAENYAGQIERVGVVSECTCGCPSIDLAMRDQKTEVRGGSIIISDVVGASPEGVQVNVILHVRGDVLSELEVYAVGGTVPFSLPRPEDLKRWEDAAV